MRKSKPLIPKSHMDASYMLQLTKLAEELDMQYEQKFEMEASKQPVEAEEKEIAELELSWNSLVKMSVMDRAERKRCMIG
jgi:hypothetical protein